MSALINTLVTSVMQICTNWPARHLSLASAIVSAFGTLLKLEHGHANAKETTCYKTAGAFHWKKLSPAVLGLTKQDRLTIISLLASRLSKTLQQASATKESIGAPPAQAMISSLTTQWECVCRATKGSMVAKDATERVTNAIRASMATTGKMMAHALTVALMTANAIAVMK